MPNVSTTFNTAMYVDIRKYYLHYVQYLWLGNKRGTELDCECVSNFSGPHCEFEGKKDTADDGADGDDIGDDLKYFESVVDDCDDVPVVVTIVLETNDTTATAILAVGLIALIVSLIISEYTFVRNRDFQQQILLRDAHRRLALAPYFLQTINKTPYIDTIPTNDPLEIAKLATKGIIQHGNRIEIWIQLNTEV